MAPTPIGHSFPALFLFSLLASCGDSGASVRASSSSGGQSGSGVGGAAGAAGHATGGTGNSGLAGSSGNSTGGGSAGSTTGGVGGLGGSGVGGASAGSGGLGLGGMAGAGGSGGIGGSCDIDLVLAVDTHPEMGEETARLQESLPGFLDQLAAGGAETRVVLIAPRYEGGLLSPGLCLGEYFGNYPGCVVGTMEPSVPPVYLQQQVSLSSGDLLDPLLPLTTEWQPYLRAGAFRPIVAISDTDSTSTQSGSDWIAQIAAVSAPGSWILHSLTPEEVCFGAVSDSTNWTLATESTGGEVFDLCNGVASGLQQLANRLLEQAGCVDATP